MDNFKADSRSTKQEILVFLQLLLTPVLIYGLASLVIYIQGFKDISQILIICIWLIGAIPGTIIGFKYYSNTVPKILFAFLYPLLMYPLLLLEMLLTTSIITGNWL